MKCYDCYNFLTKKVTEENIGSSWLRTIAKVAKKLKVDGEVQAYWCKHDFLPNKIYVSCPDPNWNENRFVRALNKKNCPKGNFEGMQ